MSIDFLTFMEQKARILLARPDVVDLTETNIAAAFGHLRPDPPAHALPGRTHRCHLAQFWLDALGLPRALAPQALVSEGVRHSLGALFAGYAALGLRVRIPSDVYPVYADIAARAGLDVSTYRASEGVRVDALDGADVLLLTNPAKPWGTWTSEREVAIIAHWLAQDGRRRVLIDAVYTWEASLHRATLALFDTGQAIVLHSLSKGWLRPLVLGIALVPRQDVDLWTPIFRALAPGQDGLRMAQALLTEHAGFPGTMPALLGEAASALHARLAAAGLRVAEVGDAEARYHFVITRSWQALLAEHAILALPASVFGHPSTELSIVTSLPPRGRAAVERAAPA